MTTPDPFAAPQQGGPPPPPPQPPYGQQPPGSGYSGDYAGPGSAGGYVPPAAYGAPPGYGAPGAGGWQPAPQTETKAMIALGLAIAAYTPTIPFIGAIAAIVLARLARRDILASNGTKTGLGLCTWATVLSVLHLIALLVLALLFFGVLLVPFIAAS